MKRAVVLGAAGFVGRYVAKALAADGYDVVGIGHGSWTRAEQEAWGLSAWHQADVTLDALLTYAGEPDVLIQCAGSGSVAFSMTHPVQDYHRSVSTTLAGLEFVRLQAPDCRYILPSSAAVYGNADVTPIPVDAPLRPVSPYGTHKVIAEHLCRSYGRNFGVQAAVVRLFSVYGIGLRKQLLWDACRKLRADEATFGGSGRELRDWLHIEDAANLLRCAAAAANSDVPTANGGTGHGVSTGHIVTCLAQALDYRGDPQFAGAQRAGDPLNQEADVAQARSWAWAPRRDLDQELRRYAEWFAQLPT